MTQDATVVEEKEVHTDHVVEPTARAKSADGRRSKARKQSRAKKKDDVYVTMRWPRNDQHARSLLVEVEGKDVLMHFCSHQGCRFSSRKRTDLERHLRTHTGSST